MLLFLFLSVDVRCDDSDYYENSVIIKWNENEKQRIVNGEFYLAMSASSNRWR